MINPDFELERLKDLLRSKGLPEQVVDSMYNDAAREINLAIADQVAEAMSEAAEAGVSQNAMKFVDELKAVRVGNSFEIGTDSGDLHFREPPFPMMSNLLKNAKVARDGTLYKHIPMSDSRSGDGSRNMTSLMNVQRGIRDAQAQAKSSWGTGPTTDISGAAMQFSGLYASQKANIRNETIRQRNLEKNPSSNVKFRTVTSKQDPATQWVQPAKDNDMSSIVNDINNRLKVNIDSVIISIIQRYGE